jgi:hypothetical protein
VASVRFNSMPDSDVPPSFPAADTTRFGAPSAVMRASHDWFPPVVSYFAIRAWLAPEVQSVAEHSIQMSKSAPSNVAESAQ